MIRITIVGLYLLLFSALAWAGTLVDDFSDGNFDGWTPISFVEGQVEWQVKDGRLIGTRFSNWSGGLVIGEDDWRDYSTEVDATLLQKLGDWSLIAIALHFQGNARNWRNVWMSYGFRPNKGKVASMVAYDHPNWLQDVSRAMPFEIGQTYHLKGVVSRNQYRFYIDGQLVLKIQENRFPSGKVGIYLNSAKVWFDNVVIKGDDVPDGYLSVKPHGKLTTIWGRLKKF